MQIEESPRWRVVRRQLYDYPVNEPVEAGPPNPRFLVGEHLEITPWRLVVLDQWVELERALLHVATQLLVVGGESEPDAWSRTKALRRKQLVDEVFDLIEAAGAADPEHKRRHATHRLLALRNKLAHRMIDEESPSPAALTVTKIDQPGVGSNEILTYRQLEATADAGYEVLRWISSSLPNARTAIVHPTPGWYPGKQQEL